MPSGRILLIEDDRDLGALLARLLGGEGYEVVRATDGPTGLASFLEGTADAVVLDRGLPGLEGLEVLARARAQGVRTPTLVLSSRGETRDRIAGLDAGAEDYLVKPFDADELLARLRSLLRRGEGDGSGAAAARERQLRLGGRVIDAGARTATDPTGRHRVVELSEREVELLLALAADPERAFSREALRELVFTDAESDAVVDTYVHYCRKKLGRDAVRTVRGVGYRIGR